MDEKTSLVPMDDKISLPETFRQSFFVIYPLCFIMINLQEERENECKCSNPVLTGRGKR